MLERKMTGFDMTPEFKLTDTLWKSENKKLGVRSTIQCSFKTTCQKWGLRHKLGPI